MKKIMFAILLALMAYESQQKILIDKDRRLIIIAYGMVIPIMSSQELEFRKMEAIINKMHSTINLVDAEQLARDSPIVQMQEALALIESKLGNDNPTVTKEDAAGKLAPIEKMNEAIFKIRAAIMKHQHIIYDRTEIPRDTANANEMKVKQDEPNVKQNEPKVKQDDDYPQIEAVNNAVTTVSVASDTTSEDIIKKFILPDNPNDNQEDSHTTTTFHITVEFQNHLSARDLFEFLVYNGPIRILKLDIDILRMAIEAPDMTAEMLTDYFSSVNNYKEFKTALFALVDAVYLQPVTVNVTKFDLNFVLDRIGPLLKENYLRAYGKCDGRERKIYFQKVYETSNQIGAQEYEQIKGCGLNYNVVEMYFPNNEIGRLLYAATSQIVKEEKKHPTRFLVFKTHKFTRKVVNDKTA